MTSDDLAVRLGVRQPVATGIGGIVDSILGHYLPLDDDRRKVIAFWAPLVVEATRLAAQLGGLDRQRRHVLDRASWAVTEIDPGPDTKLFRQRFWTYGALEWASQTLTATMRKTERGRLAAAALQHEHVVCRSALVPRLAACTDAKAAADVLGSAVACVVTRAEARRLVGEDDWPRYQRAGVQVYDRQTQHQRSAG